MQTIPEPVILRTEFALQTEEVLRRTFETQTEPPPPPVVKVTSSMEIQTDALDETPEISRSPSPVNAASMVSSSSTVVPSTPRPLHSKLLQPSDLPPAYDHEDADELARAAETLKAWHTGVSIPITPVAGGISDEAYAAWKQLQEETGVGCKVIDQIVDASPKTGRHGRQQSSKFYNIYNTYVYGSPAGPVSHALMGVGVAALAFVAFGQLMINHYHNPLIPTAFYERTTWAALNTVDAAGDGFFGFLGQLSGNAAMTVATGSNKAFT